MFIVPQSKQNRLKPHRGGMVGYGAGHAAPTELERMLGMRGHYKHVAPTELARGGLVLEAVCGTAQQIGPADAGNSSGSIERYWPGMAGLHVSAL